jgi:hypothetical protein
MSRALRTPFSQVDPKTLNIPSDSLTNLAVKISLGGVGRAATVVASMVAWFALSNHCALGAIESRVKTSGHACHQDCADSAPTKGKKPSNEGVCCKLLRATLSKAESGTGYDTSVFVWQQYFVASLFSWDEARPASSPEELDTGPPFLIAFAESVLQRSILAHAPPALA